MSMIKNFTGSVKSSIVSWFKPAAAAADNFSIASAAETSCNGGLIMMEVRQQ